MRVLRLLGAWVAATVVAASFQKTAGADLSADALERVLADIHVAAGAALGIHCRNNTSQCSSDGAWDAHAPQSPHNAKHHAVDSHTVTSVVRGGSDGNVQLPLKRDFSPVRYGVDTGAGGPERLYYYPEFLSPDDCQFLIDRATPLFKGSDIMDVAEARKAKVRQSETAYLSPDSDRMVSILERINTAVGLPMANREDFQLTRYPEGGFYGLHYDSSLSLGRIATFLIYLTTVEDAGGETMFPFARTGTSQKLPSVPRSHGSEKPPLKPFCESDEVVKFAPVAGSAVFWFNHHADLTMDYNAIHGSCPVHNRNASAPRQQKIIAQQWFRWYSADDGNAFFDMLSECNLV